MAYSPPQHTNGLTLILPTHDTNTPYSTSSFRPAAARRTPSFSSESSLESLFSSNDDSYPPHSPTTPLKLKGIPFSWEQIPGIPKHQESKNMKKKEYSEHLLPPPPAGNSNPAAAAKKPLHHSTNIVRSLQRDPFFAALVKCSKNGHDHNHNHGTNFGNMISSKITRTLYAASCKRTCSVSESIVCLPTSSPRYLFYNRR